MFSPIDVRRNHETMELLGKHSFSAEKYCSCRMQPEGENDLKFFGQNCH